jgi:hypothetical protein
MVSSLELKFDELWNSLYPDVDLDTEIQLIPRRKFRFDYVHYASKTAIELNGGIFINGGHTGGRSQIRDYKKNLLAMMEGYVVITLGTDMITTENLARIKTIIDRRLGLFDNQNL